MSIEVRIREDSILENLISMSYLLETLYIRSGDHEGRMLAMKLRENLQGLQRRPSTGIPANFTEEG